MAKRRKYELDSETADRIALISLQTHLSYHTGDLNDDEVERVKALNLLIDYYGG